MTNTTNLVHEADAQRHHVRVKLPAKVEINNTLYEVKDWSTGGASLSVPADNQSGVFVSGKTYQVRMVFDFTGFSLFVPMTVEVRHTQDEQSAVQVGLRFIDMTAEQIVIMQHLVGSYVTGELGSVGELIHVLSRNNFTKPRQVPKREEDMTVGEKISHFTKKAMVPLVSIGLLAYVSMAVFEQNFVVSAEKAVVTGDAVAVVAPSGGIVSFKGLHNGDQVKKGDVLMTVKSDTGTIVGIDSPCDCVVRSRSVDSGSVVNKGTVIADLMPIDDPLYVMAYVSYKEATRLSKGDKVTLSFAKLGQSYEGKITGIALDRISGDRAEVVVRPITQIPAEMIGLPVTMKINTLINSGE